ncbi:acyl-CoA dehydrogenase [Desulfitobacterium hafniense]|uniref:acyl-CoA dehydrogenase n=1 Tax=Desulfitobacterium hafniense TaxID=49338 RepID=UPI0003692ED4|nr:acyl-CoA dehydrogenase [Desulfitobacterium hafniense]
MDFRLTEEQELLLEGLREVLKEVATNEYLKECDDNHAFPQKIAEAFVEHGFALLGIPEEYGGTPCDITTQMLVTEEMSKFGVPFPCFSNSLLIDDILHFGNEQQKAITMEYAKKGLCAFSLGITEPGAGSDDSAMMATATRRNGKIYINAHKTFITEAKQRPYMLCLTRELNAPNPHKAISMWWVDMSKPGVKVMPWEKIGGNTAPTYEVYLEDVELEEEDLVGVEGEGFMNLMGNFEVERIQIAAGVLGWAEAAFEDAAVYANQRVQFGKPIGSFQLIQEKIVEMAIKIENMRNLVYKACWERENGMSLQISSATTKYYCVRAANQVIDDAMQIMGGIGYTKDHRISRLWRDVRNTRFGGGTDEIMIHIAGRAILKKYRNK